eukprot:13857284-Heterocapsa_arctica.AAC.1
MPILTPSKERRHAAGFCLHAQRGPQNRRERGTRRRPTVPAQIARMVSAAELRRGQRRLGLQRA